MRFATSLLFELMVLAIAFPIMAGDAPFKKDALSLRDVGFTPRLLDLRSAGKAKITFSLSAAAKVTLKICDWDGDAVLSQTQNSDAGRNEIELDFSALEISDGNYTFVLEAASVDKGNSIYNPGISAALKPLSIEKIQYDDKTGEISYVMPQLGMARVRIFNSGWMLVRTVRDWSPVLGGAQTVIWDGNDQSGNALKKSNPDLVCRINAYSLPENSFIVSGAGKTKPPRLEKDQIQWRTNPALADKYFHARVPRELSHDPQVKLEFLDATAKANLPMPLKLTDIIKVRMLVDPQDIKQLNNERFEVCVFVDGVLLFEDEDGTAPFTFDLTPGGLNPGPHMLSVMAMTTGDHVGVASCPFNVVQPDHKSNK